MLLWFSFYTTISLQIILEGFVLKRKDLAILLYLRSEETLEGNLSAHSQNVHYANTKVVQISQKEYSHEVSRVHVR